MIDSWISKNGPDGLAKLALKSKFSSHTLGRIRRGIVPRSILVREALAGALGCTEEIVFPVIGVTEDKQAS
jgi:transcriptional regulator with XRE-family HTH domain